MRALLWIIWLPTLLNAQKLTALPSNAPPRSLSDFRQMSSWPRLGAPPSKAGDLEAVDKWRHDQAFIVEVFGALRSEWPSQETQDAAEVRRVVLGYEEIVGRAASTEGYGNLLLSHCARRADQVLMMKYLVMHPTDYALIQDLMASQRVSLLDSQALSGALSKDMSIRPPAEGWNFARRRAHWATVLQRRGSSFDSAIRRGFLDTAPVTRLLERGDLDGLLPRLIFSETVERVTLPGLAMFLSKGGNCDDLLRTADSSFDQLMAASADNFRFEAIGIYRLRADLLAQVVQFAKRLSGKRLTFSDVVVE